MTDNSSSNRPSRPARHTSVVGIAVAIAVVVAGCASGNSDENVGANGAAPEDERPEIDSPATTNPDTTTASIGAPSTTEVASVSRCTPPPPNADTETGEVTKLQIWHGLDGDVVAFFDDVIAAFEEEHPGIDVEVSSFEGSYVDGLAQLADLDPAERPDVFMGSNASVRLQYDSGLFVPPSECTDGEVPDALVDLLPIIERTYNVDDTLVAAPYNVSTAVMMYDRRLWRAAGIDPDDPPATFDEFESVVRRLRDSGAATTGMVLYDRSASWLVEQAAAQEGRLLVEPANGRAGTAATDVLFNTPEAVATLERFRILHREGYIVWAGLNQSGRDDLLQLVSPDEPSGLTLHTSAALGDALRIVESGAIGAGIEVGTAPLPGNAPGGLAGGGAWWLLENDDPAQVGAAWTLIDWLIQPDRVAELAAFTGYVPTTGRAANAAATTASWAENPAFRVGYEQLAAMSSTDAAVGLQVGPMVELQRALEVAGSFAVNADRDPAEQLRAAEDTARSALDAYQAVYGDGS